METFFGRHPKDGRKMGTCPGPRIPIDSFSKLIVPVFLGGFVSGIVTGLVAPKSLLAFIAFGIIGGGVGLALANKVWQEDWEGDYRGALVMLAVTTVAMSYISLPGAAFGLFIFF